MPLSNASFSFFKIILLTARVVHYNLLVNNIWTSLGRFLGQMMCMDNSWTDIDTHVATVRTPKLWNKGPICNMNWDDGLPDRSLTGQRLDGWETLMPVNKCGHNTTSAPDNRDSVSKCWIPPVYSQVSHPREDLIKNKNIFSLNIKIVDNITHEWKTIKNYFWHGF